MPKKVEKVLAWHFVANGELRDGENCPPDGKKISIPDDRQIVACLCGFHGSKNIVHAINYAAHILLNSHEPISLCRVEIWGDIEDGMDKVVGRHRKILWRIEPANDVLRVASRKLALELIKVADKDKLIDKKIYNYLRTGKDAKAAYEAYKNHSFHDPQSVPYSPSKRVLESVFNGYHPYLTGTYNYSGPLMSLNNIRSAYDGQLDMKVDSAAIILDVIGKHAPKIELKPQSQPKLKKVKS